jgi:hypothetical protein
MDRLNDCAAARSNRSLVARQGAHALHAKYDSRELTKPARAKFLGRFVDDVDPNRQLPERERLRRADHAKKAYFTALARKSANARALGKHAT